ncbi:uncharacterized protein [Spinacia oleracea]|uniref:Uncharacterized protein n=1 Tax=Spinacia oleracea TaxID=3562 RepID=A0ABM3QI86_SPIOL|nr:uncharacterized protein LOC130459627 [Spinacia oleracea]
MPLFCRYSQLFDIVLSFCSVPDRQAMADEEICNIPPSKNFSSRDKTKIISSVIKVVPEEYMEQFPPAAEAQFRDIQATLLDLLIKAEGCKHWYAHVMPGSSQPNPTIRRTMPRSKRRHP